MRLTSIVPKNFLPEITTTISTKMLETSEVSTHYDEELKVSTMESKETFEQTIKKDRLPDLRPSSMGYIPRQWKKKRQRLKISWSHTFTGKFSLYGFMKWRVLWKDNSHSFKTLTAALEEVVAGTHPSFDLVKPLACASADSPSSNFRDNLQCIMAIHTHSNIHEYSHLAASRAT